MRKIQYAKVADKIIKAQVYSYKQRMLEGEIIDLLGVDYSAVGDEQLIDTINFSPPVDREEIISYLKAEYPKYGISKTEERRK